MEICVYIFYPSLREKVSLDLVCYFFSFAFEKDLRDANSNHFSFVSRLRSYECTNDLYTLMQLDIF